MLPHPLPSAPAAQAGPRTRGCPVRPCAFQRNQKNRRRAPGPARAAHQLRLEGIASLLTYSSLASASCSEASYNEWLAAKPFSAVAQEQQAQATTPEDLFPGMDYSSKGSRWRIRQYADSDLLGVTELQARSFHEGLPFGALDALAYTMFKAEVLDAVKKKASSLTTHSFSMMVAEKLGPAGGQAAGAAAAAVAAGSRWASRQAAASSSSSSSSGDGSSGAALESADVEAARGVGDLAAVLAAARNQNSSGSGSSSSGSNQEEHPNAYDWLPDSSSSSSSSGGNGAEVPGSDSVAGVIEVSIQDDLEVLRHLAPDVTTYAYVSSMAVAEHLRRQGLATALLAAAEQQARLWRQPLLALHVYVENEAGLALYRSCGLESVATDPSWKAVFGGKVRTLMVKHLPLS